MCRTSSSVSNGEFIWLALGLVSQTKILYVSKSARFRIETLTKGLNFGYTFHVPNLRNNARFHVE